MVNSEEDLVNVTDEALKRSRIRGVIKSYEWGQTPKGQRYVRVVTHDLQVRMLPLGLAFVYAGAMFTTIRCIEEGHALLCKCPDPCPHHDSPDGPRS